VPISHRRGEFQLLGDDAAMKPSVRLVVVFAALSSVAWAGAMPYRGFGPTRKPHPTTVALRDYTATLRTNLGDITLALEPDAAPNAVLNFVRLAQQGVLDGQRFTCVFKDRMIVGGNPAAPGKTDPAQPIAKEAGGLSASAGAVLLDTTPDGRNAVDRFIILVSDQNHLDKDYTVFAQVSGGLDVVKRIGAVATRPNNGSPVPVEEVVIEQVLVAKKKPSTSKESDSK
jgi:peptidyl-prolyl cis-trans isomerase B (cyclophilin B)